MNSVEFCIVCVSHATGPLYFRANVLLLLQNGMSLKNKWVNDVELTGSRYDEMIRNTHSSALCILVKLQWKIEIIILFYVLKMVFFLVSIRENIEHFV